MMPSNNKTTDTRTTVKIRQAESTDFEAIWPIFHPIVSAGTTYAFDRHMEKEDARSVWMDVPQRTYVAEISGVPLGTYYLKANQGGPGKHVCNCGYMVAPAARGKGIATLMCQHSQTEALSLGYQAMQFNFVAATNTGAIKLWEFLGYKIVGTLPRAFNHPDKGFVDAHVMYKWLR